MSSYQSFEELTIGNEASRLAWEIYTLTFQQNFSGDFALTGQIRKSAGWVMDNIAEGYERNGRLEFINFLNIAKGSTDEVRSQLYRAFGLKSIEEQKLTWLIVNSKKLSSHIANFIKYLNKSKKIKETNSKIGSNPILAFGF